MRTKSVVPRLRAKKRLFKRVKGSVGGRRRLLRTAKESLIRSGVFARRDRRRKNAISVDCGSSVSMPPFASEVFAIVSSLPDSISLALNSIVERSQKWQLLTRLVLTQSLKVFAKSLDCQNQRPSRCEGPFTSLPHDVAASRATDRVHIPRVSVVPRVS